MQHFDDMMIDLILDLTGVTDIEDSPIVTARHHTGVKYVDAVAAIVSVGFINLYLWETAAALYSGSAHVGTAHALARVTHFEAFDNRRFE